MKTCNACKEPIAKEATKCPKCQSFQGRFKNNLILLSLLPLLVIPFIFLNSNSHERIDFITYKDQIFLKRLSQDTLQNKEFKTLNILVEIENQSDKKWENALFEVSFLSTSGQLLNIEKKGDYAFVVYPATKTKASLKIPLYKEYENTRVDVKLIDLRHNRY